MTSTLPATHIALLDDHALFRQGLCYILKSLPYVETVTETAGFDDLLACCRRQLPDVLLLDLQMPHKDGAEVTKELLEEFPDLKIIVLSMFAADKFITQMVKLGVRSYLPKDADQRELVRAIEEVLATGYHFTPRISRALMRGVQQPSRQNPVRMLDGVHFTPRELEVLRMICQGRTAPEIAETLFISRRTAEGHRQKLLEKTGAANIALLVVFAAKNGLLDEG